MTILNPVDLEYTTALRHVMDEGEDREDRTGVGTRGVFGAQLVFKDINQFFPLLTLKKVHFKSIVYELLWFISGSTNVKDLQKNGVTIWDEWATKEQCAKFGREEGDLGPVYGHQWRDFGGNDVWRGVDQLKNVVEEIKKNPYSRRLIVTGWNPREATQVALPPCHTLFQFHVSNGKLNCQLYQRSGDMFLGVPFNIASYALLTMMVAQVTGLKPGKFILSLGDAHIYKNHFEQVKELLSRSSKSSPTVLLNPAVKSLFDFKREDVLVMHYNPHPAIKAPVAV